MQHILVCESARLGERFIRSLGDNGFWFEPVLFNGSSMKFTVRCKYSGRLDDIYIAYDEQRIHGHRFDGQLLAMDDSYLVDGLLMYARHNIRPISRRKDAVDDETLFWHWATSNTSSGTGDNERDCFAACIKSVEAEKRSRNRS